MAGRLPARPVSRRTTACRAGPQCGTKSLPILLPLSSVNQTLPSGPMEGLTVGSRDRELRDVTIWGEPPDLIAVDLREIHDAVGTGDDAERLAVRRRNRELAGDPLRSIRAMWSLPPRQRHLVISAHCALLPRRAMTLPYAVAGCKLLECLVTFRLGWRVGAKRSSKNFVIRSRSGRLRCA